MAEGDFKKMQDDIEELRRFDADRSFALTQLGNKLEIAQEILDRYEGGNLPEHFHELDKINLINIFPADSALDGNVLVHSRGNWRVRSTYAPIDTELDTGETWHDGKRIFRVVFNFGSLPNSALLLKDIVPTITSASISEVIYLKPIDVATSTRSFFDSFIDAGTEISFMADTATTNLRIGIRSDSDVTAHTAKIIIEYTKV